MTTIGFVRHGETDWNSEGRAQGLKDIPLNPEGNRQAERLAARLAKEDWDMIYSSDLSRARKTAEIIGEAIGKPVHLDVRLREKTHGRLDGTTVADRVQRWGDGWRELDHGEEQVEQIVTRSMDFLQEITARYPEEKVLIVSHGAWIFHTMELMLKGEEISFIGNSSLCILKNTGESWDCLLMGCLKHLEVTG